MNNLPLPYFDIDIASWYPLTEDEIYYLYCQNLMRTWFIDNYLRSIEHYRLAVQHRINYIVRRLHL